MLLADYETSEAKLLIFVGAADGTPLLPPAVCSKSTAVQARPVDAKDTAGFVRERYGGRRISSLVGGKCRKGAPMAPWDVSAETQSRMWSGNRSWEQLHEKPFRHFRPARQAGIA